MCLIITFFEILEIDKYVVSKANQIEPLTKESGYILCKFWRHFKFSFATLGG